MRHRTALVFWRISLSFVSAIVANVSNACPDMCSSGNLEARAIKSIRAVVSILPATFAFVGLSGLSGSSECTAKAV